MASSISALTLLVGWQEGRVTRQKPVPIIPTDSLPEQMQEETAKELANPG